MKKVIIIMSFVFILISGVCRAEILINKGVFGTDKEYHTTFEITDALKSELRLVPGVEYVHTTRYALDITIGNLFRWVDVEPEIIDVLMKYNQRGDQTGVNEPILPELSTLPAHP